jgi:hypothetical protein
MSIPTFVIRELKTSTSPLFGSETVSINGECYTLGEPIVADERAYRKYQKREWRENPDKKLAEMKRREDPVYKAKAIETTQAFRAANPDYVKNQNSADYHKPFVIIDSEGCRDKNSEPKIINQETESAYEKRVKRAARKGLPKPARNFGIEYPVHCSFLWAASYWQRDKPGIGNGPMSDTNPLGHSGNRGADGGFSSIERRDKSNIPAEEILFWLTGLKHEFLDAIFSSFSFGYDSAQILKGVPFKIRKKICRNQYEDDDGVIHDLEPRAYKYWVLPVKKRTPEYDGYGLAYLKGKWFSACKIKWLDDEKKYKQFDHITIYDVYSFYGMRFTKAIECLVPLATSPKPNSSRSRPTRRVVTISTNCRSIKSRSIVSLSFRQRAECCSCFATASTSWTFA